MEFTLNNQKQKKRRSRKNLDAIRKKNRQTPCYNIYNKSSLAKTNYKKKSSALKTNNLAICLTSNRLTLFGKAVSSDTVSRAPEIKREKHDNLNKIGKISFVKKPITTLKEKDCDVFTNNSNSQFEVGVLYDRNTDEISSYKTSNDIISFSPCSTRPWSEDSDISDKLQIPQHWSDHVFSSSSAATNNYYCENDFYKKFMKEIPNYLQQTVSTLLKTEIVHKYRDSLRNLYIENDYFETKDSSVFINGGSCIFSGYERITQNPINSLRKSNQNEVKSDSMLSSIVSYGSQHSIGQSSSPVSLIVSDSPEYIYYPHKLNQ